MTDAEAERPTLTRFVSETKRLPLVSVSNVKRTTLLSGELLAAQTLPWESTEIPRQKIEVFLDKVDLFPGGHIFERRPRGGQYGHHRGW